MKRAILSLFTFALLLMACSNEELIERSSFSPETIFEKTGCYPTEVNTIKSYTLFKDSIHGINYLYGARTENNKDHFWIAQYNSEGTECWSLVQSTGNQESYADQPVLLANGNLLVADVRRDTLDNKKIRAILPTIIATQNGSFTRVAVADTFAYTTVQTFDNFFFCSLDPQTKLPLMSLQPSSIQVRNTTGKIIAQAAQLYIPHPEEGSCQITWADDTTYIQQTPLLIEKYQVRQGEVWSYEIALPDYQKCNMSTSISNNIVSSSYQLTQGEKEQSYTYQLFYDSGKPYVQATGILISAASQTLYVDDSFTLTATVQPSNASFKEIVWSSSDRNIATVDANGKVTALAPGTCQIHVSTQDGRYQASCTITVKQKWVEDITQYIALEFESSNIEWKNNLVSGSIFSKLVNKSTIATIRVTGFRIEDKFHDWTFKADASLLDKEVAPSSSYRLGSHNFSNLYLPEFVWEYEYHDKRYTIRATFTNPNADTDPTETVDTKAPNIIIISE
ncbi:MAG: Ig domain-containing protein [Parabacteroides sp.]